MYYTYILRTEGGSLYTGITCNMFRRMAEHKTQGKRCAKYTKSRKILSLEALWSSENRQTASRLEYALKTLTKKEKEALLKNPHSLSCLLPQIEKEDYIHHPKANLALFLKEITLDLLP